MDTPPNSTKADDRQHSTVHVSIPKELKDKTEDALDVFEKETGVKLTMSGWMARVYAATWKSELEKFKKKVGPVGT